MMRSQGCQRRSSVSRYSFISSSARAGPRCRGGNEQRARRELDKLTVPCLTIIQEQKFIESGTFPELRERDESFGSYNAETRGPVCGPSVPSHWSSWSRLF